MKIAVFGYGSLVNLASLEATLDRKVDEHIMTYLDGWIRDWTVDIENTDKDRYFEFIDGTGLPEAFVVLNIRKDISINKSKSPNGILFECTQTELEKLVRREAHYDLVDVTPFIRDTNGYDKIYTFVGKSKYLATNSSLAITPKSYMDLVEEGFKSMSQQDLDTFNSTTIPTAFPIKSTRYVSNNKY